MSLVRNKKLKKKQKIFEKFAKKETYCNLTNDSPILTKESLEAAFKTCKQLFTEKGKRFNSRRHYDYGYESVA